MKALVLVAFLLLAAKEDDYEIISPQKEKTFSNPLLISAPDPWVEQKNDWYYVMHTTGKDLRLYRTKKMSALGLWNPRASRS